MLDDDETRSALADAARTTTPRRLLETNPNFNEISPSVGVLDEAAFDAALAADPDRTLGLLADLTGATDEVLRQLAGRLAARVMVEVARRGLATAAGTGRLVRRRGGAGDLDLDASTEAIAALRRHEPGAAEELTHVDWRRPRLGLCLVVDRSGSMHGERLAAAAVTAAAAVLRHDCAVLVFGKDTAVLRRAGSARSAGALVEDLLRLRGTGTTDLATALTAAAGELAAMSATDRRVVLLSDCRVTAGADPTPVARQLDHISIISPAGDDDAARELARACGAACTALAGPSDAARALNAVLA